MQQPPNKLVAGITIGIGVSAAIGVTLSNAAAVYVVTSGVIARLIEPVLDLMIRVGFELIRDEVMFLDFD
jgi:hypothetical protein